jgi:hypothetical protein
VVNYPWDGAKDLRDYNGKENLCPDDAAYVRLAHVYADSNPAMKTNPVRGPFGAWALRCSCLRAFR